MKLVKHTNNVLKCGFPEASLDKYLSIFNNLNLKVEIIDNFDNKKTNQKLEKYLVKIKNMNLNEITAIESLNILAKLKELL